jgi:hypothetical protein
MSETQEQKPQPQPQVDPNQKVETNAYVPTYKLSPGFKAALLKAIGSRPFNEISGLINAINVPTVDHNTLTQIINAIGQFPYNMVEQFMLNINNYIEQVLE